MKKDNPNQFSLAGKPIYSTPYPFLNFLSCLLLLIFGLTFLILFFFHYKSNISFNLQIINGQFSINLTTQSLLNQSTAPLSVLSSPNQEINISNNDSKTRDTITWKQNILKTPAVMHGMDDEELLQRASMVPKIGEFQSNFKPKVAFMFLTKRSVVLAPLWEKFFKGHEGFYSIYVHSSRSYNQSEPEDSVFHGRRIPSKEVKWGDINMIEAERRLIANALLDFSNQRFVLLSESCIPLYNFSTVYSYLMNSTQNFVEAYDQPGPNARGRYRQGMRPTIKLGQWRKGSQWFAIDRDLAVDFISDEKYFPIFQKLCHGGPCVADEHYLQTFVTIEFGSRNSNRSLTWVDWSRGGPHPERFIRTHVTPDFLEKLRSGGSCEYNGNRTNVCFLFARKFTHDALNRLLRFAPKIMRFDR